MDIRTEYKEFRTHLNEEIKQMVKDIYKKVYKINTLADEEDYVLYIDDIPYNKKGILSIDVYVLNMNEEDYHIEKQIVQSLTIVNEKRIEIETTYPISINNLTTEEVIKIYEYLDKINKLA